MKQENKIGVVPSHRLVLILTLALFWWINSNYSNPLLLSLGVGSIMLVLYIAQKMDVIDQETHPIRLNANMPSYALWLAKQVVLSNISVVKHIWMGNSSIAPTLTNIDTRQCSDINKVIYANSITLTPGTVAIDLIDEAASSIRMQIDSKPEELDKLERRTIQLKLEQQALTKEEDEASKKRLHLLSEELLEKESAFKELDEVWKAEKAALSGTQNIKSELEQARLDLEFARRASDLSRMSELQYGRIPELEKQLDLASQAEMQDMTLLRHRVSENEIADVLSRWTGIPVSKMLEGERDKLLKMENQLHTRVIGQNEAVEAVSNAIRRSRAGLSDPNKPIGSFLFLGPTGVGKTELCKALANFLFDTEDNMVRIDMSEFMEKHSVARLVGAPPGYVGYEEGGYLTEAVRRKPYSVILLDEVEKAHPDVFNILLQVLDDGRLTDGQGRTVDFRNTVIIMTSNLGSDVIQEHFQHATYDEMKERVLGVLTQSFRPEFLNRVDETVVFHPLFGEHIKAIAGIQLQRLQTRLRERDYQLEVSDAALSHIAEAGFDSVYGARPLKRAIQQELENPLAQGILSGKLLPGSPIYVDMEGEHFSFTQH